MARLSWSIPLALSLSLAACGEGTLSGSDEGSLASRATAGERAWLCPNVASPDLVRMFDSPDEWPRARARLGVFQLYAQQVGADDPSECASCGPNLFPALVRAGAFQKLQRWGVDLSLELGAVKHHTCKGADAAAYADHLAGRVEAAGGKVRFVAMDEPYVGGEMKAPNGQTCGYSRDQSADEVARFAARLGTLRPGIRVGDIEPYPYYRPAQLEEWIDALRARGVTPAFFHLDVDRLHARNLKLDVARDLVRMRDFCAARNIPFGVIFWGHEGEFQRGTSQGLSAERAYYQQVMSWVGTVRAAIGAPDHAIFQSWTTYGGGNVYPRNLPEGDVSHAKLLIDGLDALGVREPAPSTPASSTPVPPTPAPTGDVAEVKVAASYLGLLGRAPDPGGLSSFGSAVRRGMPTLDLCRALVGSDEFRQSRSRLSADALAAELYRGILRREGDPGGLSGTVSEIRAGRTADRAAAMIESDEFRHRR